ncbi:MAG: TIGR04211 family SH3 domain-containing protein [Thermodesulfobacteriota bacterium]|nr:TIGR04211 family SH3 domain-containing protein [Thermodesulfobacteriota bacterium]
MKKIHINTGIVLIILGFCLMSGQSLADDAYVTDSFKVTLRTGPSTENKIISMVSSGQPVEILKSENAWSLVRLKDNSVDKEGWVLSRYLMKRRPWKAEAKSLQGANTEMKVKLPKISKGLDDALRREKVLVTKLKEKSSQFDNLKNEYESLKIGAASYLELSEKQDATRIALEKTQEELQRLTEENRVLISSKRNLWFLSGALVLLFGLIIGLAIGRKQTRHRSSLYF